MGIYFIRHFRNDKTNYAELTLQRILGILLRTGKIGRRVPVAIPEVFVKINSAQFLRATSLSVLSKMSRVYPL